MDDIRYTKAVLVEKAAGEDKVYHFIASDETVDRQGDIVTADGWQTENFAKNPVFLWAHRYDAPPLGKVVEHEVRDGALRIGVVFDAEDPFARQVQRKYDQGFLSAVSVGFQPLERVQPRKAGEPTRITQKELLEVSAVPVPANPNALIARQLKGLLAAVEGPGPVPAEVERRVQALSRQVDWLLLRQAGRRLAKLSDR